MQNIVKPLEKREVEKTKIICWKANDETVGKKEAGVNIIFESPDVLLMNGLFRNS